MKKLLLAVTFLMSFGALAQSRVAETVCRSLTFDSNKSECLQIISNGYVEDRAAKVCQSMSFDSNKVDCLKAVVNKSYTDGELSICASSTFDSNKVECLEENGEIFRGQRTGDISNEAKLNRIERLARRVKRQLYQGDVIGAIANMTRIIELATIEDQY